MKNISIIFIIAIFSSMIIANGQVEPVESTEWNEKLVLSPNFPHTVEIPKVSRGDTIMGSFVSHTAPINFYIIEVNSRVYERIDESAPLDMPIYSANLASNANFNVTIPFDGMLIIYFINPTIGNTMIEYNLSYEEGDIEIPEGARIWDEAVELSPDFAVYTVTIPQVEIGDIFKCELNVTGGTINFYVLLIPADQTLLMKENPVIPYLYVGNLVDKTDIELTIPTSGTLILYFNLPGSMSNRTVAYHAEYVGFGPLARYMIREVSGLPVPGIMKRAILPFTIETLRILRIIPIPAFIYNFLVMVFISPYVI